MMTSWFWRPWIIVQVPMVTSDALLRFLRHLRLISGQFCDATAPAQSQSMNVGRVYNSATRVGGGAGFAGFVVFALLTAAACTFPWR